VNERTPFDLLAIGAGPVGLACGVEAARQGLTHLLVERGSLLNTLVKWPTFTVFFSTPELLEIGGVPFVCAGSKPTRREGLVYYRKVADHFGLNLRLYEEVERIVRDQELFGVTTSKATYHARQVVAATGFFDTPNLLGVPGEELAKVSHYYREPFPYAGTEVLVIGGRNSAVEAALDLYRNGARVTMAVRKPAFGESVKYWLRPDIENRVKEGSIRALFETVVEEILPASVRLVRRGERMEIPNDFVLALTGYRPDFGFLRGIGIEVTPDGRIVHDEETMETSVPGLYVAGVVAAGVEIGKLFIENGREHAVRIVRHILKTSGRSPVEPLGAPPVRRFQDGD
jgi:thioredoxin reductase (NADPH)